MHCTEVLQRTITEAFGSVAKKIEEAKQEQQSAVEKIKKRRFEGAGTYSAVASQAAAQTATAQTACPARVGTSQVQASQKPNEQDAKLQAAKEAFMAAARDEVAGKEAKQAQSS